MTNLPMRIRTQTGEKPHIFLEELIYYLRANYSL